MMRFRFSIQTGTKSTSGRASARWQGPVRNGSSGRSVRLGVPSRKRISEAPASSATDIRSTATSRRPAPSRSVSTASKTRRPMKLLIRLATQ